MPRPFDYPRSNQPQYWGGRPPYYDWSYAEPRPREQPSLDVLSSVATSKLAARGTVRIGSKLRVAQGGRWLDAVVTSLSVRIDTANTTVSATVAYDSDVPSARVTVTLPDDVRSGDVQIDDEQPIAELDELLLFFLCQVRAEFAEFVANDGEDRCGDSRRPAYQTFDAELARFEGDKGFTAIDLAAWDARMRSFVTTSPWTPWHAALGVHEMYMLSVVRKLPGLTTARERHVLGYAFAAMRDVELFDAVFRPLYAADASDDSRQLGGLVLNRPDIAFAKNGPLHARYRGKRRKDDGAVDRARRHVELGHQAFDAIERRLVDGVRKPNDDLGPRDARMFQLATHVTYPHLGLLDDDSPLDDETEAAFDVLFPSARRHRHHLVPRLYDHLASGRAGDLFVRFQHMLRWTTVRAIAKFAPDVLPQAAFSPTLTRYDLQGNLAEWTRFREHLRARNDVSSRNPTTASPTVAAAASRNGKRRRRDSSASGSSVKPKTPPSSPSSPSSSERNRRPDATGSSSDNGTKFVI